MTTPTLATADAPRIFPPHAPYERVVIATLDDWEVRQFDDARLPYFAARGFAHLQLWNGPAQVSVLTPSRITGGTFETWCTGVRRPFPTWREVERFLGARGVATPGPHTIRALEQWFILPSETPAGRLLRVWWSV